ncbi:dihydrofolate reductase [mine drainage metagenome]|uniref:Dihydrofolate reductase n=1 Tax=mine drainage metagenome TaxID=410659 RepID=A0A1J5SNM2_9ZZZZ
MVIKCSLFVATILDGFIARKCGALDWLPGSDGVTESENHGYTDFFASIDSLVKGRNTCDLMHTFGEWLYPGKKVLVLSSRFPKIPIRLAEEAKGTSMPPMEVVRQLEASGSAHAYVDGGKTIQSFLQAGLIQDVMITRVPVLIGEGIPLFGSSGRDIRLRHLSTGVLENGLVQSKYQVENAA